MVKCIAYEREDGGVAIIYPVADAMLPNETEQQFLDRVRVRDVPAGSPVAIIDSSDLPSRESREHWTLSGGVVSAPVSTST